MYVWRKFHNLNKIQRIVETDLILINELWPFNFLIFRADLPQYLANMVNNILTIEAKYRGILESYC